MEQEEVREKMEWGKSRISGIVLTGRAVLGLCVYIYIHTYTNIRQDGKLEEGK